MRKGIETFLTIFAVIIFLTFLINHGKLDFSGVDWLVSKGKEVASSEEAQDIASELKDITYDTAKELTQAAKELISDYKASNELAPVELVSVVDGDTIYVKYEEENIKIRLIGIDTPESVHADEEKNNIYGEYASDYTKEILENTDKVYLEFDEETEDVYGRLLAYVWLSNEKAATTENIGKYMLNGILVADGYAMDKVYEPNDRYAANFTKLRKTAEENQDGLWQYEEFAKLWED